MNELNGLTKTAVKWRHDSLIAECAGERDPVKKAYIQGKIDILKAVLAFMMTEEEEIRYSGYDYLRL